MDTPAYLTRFYGEVDFALDVVANQQITFVHASLLNDPFDPYYFFETDFDDNYASLLHHVKVHHPADIGWFRAAVKPLSWITTVKDLKSYLENNRRTTFVLSTSAESQHLHPKDNLYMWGHYGKGHRGIAIEFDTLALENAVLAHHATINGNPFQQGSIWSKVEYAESFSPISAEDIYDFMKQSKEVTKRRDSKQAVTRLEQYYELMSKVKSDVWRSENEWRLMWRSDDVADKIYKCPITADCINTIYLGLSLPQNAQDMIVLATRAGYPSAKIMKATKRHGNLALDFCQI